MLTVIVMTDGRADCLARTVASLEQRLAGPVAARVIHDDSGDPSYAHWLRDQFPAYQLAGGPGRAGYAGAVRSAWAWLREHCRTEWVFHTEDDFEFLRTVDAAAMASVMAHRPIAQMALLRQPWNDQERAAGGIIEQHPGDYRDCTDGRYHWLQHRRFFTTNPFLTRTRFIRSHDWPQGPNSEGRFGVDLFAAEPLTTCAFWGQRGSGPWVEHIGGQRAGTGY